MITVFFTANLEFYKYYGGVGMKEGKRAKKTEGLTKNVKVLSQSYLYNRINLYDFYS